MCIRDRGICCIICSNGCLELQIFLRFCRSTRSHLFQIFKALFYFSRSQITAVREFDAVFQGDDPLGMLDVYKRQGKAYAEWMRVLKKGGRLLNFDANWYHHLFDEEKRKEYEEDRKRVENLHMDDHYTCTDIDAMEDIAKMCIRDR